MELSTQSLDEAFSALAKRFTWHCRVEILVVGGAAGMVTGLLPKERTTADCDVIQYAPEQAWTAVETAAEEVGRELGLPKNWLNSHVHIRQDCLPSGWIDRRRPVAEHESLFIYAISRVDLIAMKFIAHRPQDLEDLVALRVRPDDVEFVRQYLIDLERKGSNQKEIDEARMYLDSWELTDYEPIN